MKSRLLLPHSLVNTIYYVNARFLSQLYKKENAFNGQDFNLHFTKQRNGIDAIIPRPNHGLAHSLRVAAYIPLIIDFLKKHGSHDNSWVNAVNQLTEKEITFLQIAALFSVVGRLDETGFNSIKQNTAPDVKKKIMQIYRNYREASANFFLEYVEKEFPNVDHKELEFWSSVVLEMGNIPFYANNVAAMKDNAEIFRIPQRHSHIVDIILHMAHCMDLFRCMDLSGSHGIPEPFQIFFNCTNQTDSDFKKDSEVLLQFATKALRQTGNKLISYMDNDGVIRKAGTKEQQYQNNFHECNTDVDVALKEINSVKYTIENVPSSTETRKEKTVKKDVEPAPSFTELNSQPDGLAKKIAADFEKNGALVKSVRFDNRSFNLKFIDGITKTPLNQPIEDQRKDPHKKFTVLGLGAFARSKKPSPYAPLSPDEIAEQKKERSRFQATSLVTPEAQIPVFGHSKTRANKLAGYLFDPNDAMINRMFIYDGGTVSRPYEFDTYGEALAYYQRVTNPDNPVMFASMEEFKKAIATKKNKYNEVLARIRWNINSSAIGVFSDTFEARCIAQMYALQMKDRLKKQYQELGKPWDDSYEIPIIHYIPGSPKNWKPYTKEEQLADREQAQRIFQDEILCQKAFDDDNLEFLLLLKNPDEIFNLKTQDKNLLLIDLLYRGKFQLVESLLYRTSFNENNILKYFQQYSDVKLIPDKQGKTPLHLAAELGHSTLKFFLINKKLNVNVADTNGSTALMYAASRGPTETVKALLADSRIDINVSNEDGETALMFAAQSGHTETVKALLADSRIDINIRNKINGATALMRAAQSGHTETVKALLADSRIDFVNCVSGGLSWGKSALMWAASNGHTETVKALLADSRITVNTCNICNTTPLMEAVINGHTDTIKALLSDSRVEVKAIDFQGMTAFMYAFRNDVNFGSIRYMNLFNTDQKIVAFTGSETEFKIGISCIFSFVDYKPDVEYRIDKILKIKSANEQVSITPLELYWITGKVKLEDVHYTKMIIGLFDWYKTMRAEADKKEKASTFSLTSIYRNVSGGIKANLKINAAQKMQIALLYKYEEGHSKNFNSEVWYEENKNIIVGLSSLSEKDLLALTTNDPKFFSHDDLIALQDSKLGEIVAFIDKDKLPQIYTQALQLDVSLKQTKKS